MNELKDRVYELEGLLELQSLRSDKADDLRHLIDARIKEINRIWNEAAEPAESAESAESADVVDVVDVANFSDTFDSSDSSDISAPSDPSDSSAPCPDRPVPALCLNDRYRFTRVIAGGDRRTFDSILSGVASLPDYDAARDYVLAQSHADPEDPEVMDFLEILQQYFE